MATKGFNYRYGNDHLEQADSTKKSIPANTERKKEEKYCKCKKIFTYVSKTKVGVGAGVVCEGLVVKATLPWEASIYTPKVYASNRTVGIIIRNKMRKIVIFSDTYSALQNLREIQYNDTYMTIAA